MHFLPPELDIWQFGGVIVGLLLLALGWRFARPRLKGWTKNLPNREFAQLTPAQSELSSKVSHKLAARRKTNTRR